MELFWTVFWVSAVAGPVLLVIGLRGKRVGVEPHCRKCNYNVKGINLKSDETVPCPECGFSVNLPDHTKTGKYQRRQAAFLSGSALILILLLSSAQLGMSVSATTSVQPTWLLLFQFNHRIGVASMQDGAEKIAAELRARLHQNSLTDSQLQATIPTLLHWNKHSNDHRNPHVIRLDGQAPRRWSATSFADLMTASVDRGLMSRQQKEQLLITSILSAWPRYDARRWVETELAFASPDVNLENPMQSYKIICTFKLLKAKRNGKEIQLIDAFDPDAIFDMQQQQPRRVIVFNKSERQRFTYGELPGVSSWPALPVDPLPAGNHHFQVEYELLLWLEPHSSGTWNAASNHPSRAPDATQTFSFEMNILSVSHPEDAIEITSDPDDYPFRTQTGNPVTLKAEARRNAGALELWIRHAHDRWPFLNELNDSDRYVWVCGDVELVHDNAITPLPPRHHSRSVVLNPENLAGIGQFEYPYDTLVESALLRIHPNPIGALNDSRIKRLWGKTIELPVTIDWSRAPEADRPPLPPTEERN